VIGEGKALGSFSTISGASSQDPISPSNAAMFNLSPEELKKVNIKIDNKPKTVECGNCGAENDAQIKFCSKCGMPIF